jgi:rubrerythrin
VFRHSIRTLLVSLCTLSAAAQAAPALAVTAETRPAAHNAANAANGANAANAANGANAVKAADAVDAVRPQTLADLITALGGEAFAHASYHFYGAEADREGHPAIGLLFHATAETELGEHLREAAALAGTVGTNAANLREAIKGETYEHQVMYQRFAEQAREDGDLNAAALFTEIAADEGSHRDAFFKALTVLNTGQGTIPAPPKVDVVQVPAGLPKVHAARTLANLNTAMHGEALAHAKYMLFATRAEESGNKALALLWRGTAAVELQEHFAGEAVLAGFVRTTRENLRKAIEGERYEATTMYPNFARRATAVGDTAAARFFLDTAKDEAGHAAAFQEALNRLG